MNEKHVPVSLRVFAVYTHVACAPVKQAAASRSAMASLCAFVSLCGSGGHHHLGGVRHPEVFFRSAFAPPGLLKVSNLSLILQFHVESCTAALVRWSSATACQAGVQIQPPMLGARSRHFAHP